MKRKTILLIVMVFLATVSEHLSAGGFFETGETTITDTIDNGTWITVNTQKTYVSPVVIAGPITHNNDNSISVRVRNVTPTSFQVGMQSPCQNSGGGAVACPGTWSDETVSWLVVERGTWVFPDGTKLEAYLYDTNTIRSRFGGNNNNGDLISFSHNYASAPVVLHTVNTANDTDWIASTVFGPAGGRGSAPSATGFRLALEGAEVTTSHGSESIGWVAIERGAGNNNGVPYSVGRTAGRDVDRHNDECQNIAYGNTFAGIPNLVGMHNSMQGGDGAWLRLCGNELEATQFNVHMEEDQVNDTDRTGVPEFAVWFAYQANSIGALEFITATKSFTDSDGSASVGPGETVTFNITLTNLQNDFAQADNATDEFTDVLDANFIIDGGSLTASSGSLTQTGQTLRWNGSIPASGVVNLSYSAEVASNNTVCPSLNISNQATVNMDPIDDSIQTDDTDNVNSITELSDDISTDDGADSDMDNLTGDDDPTLVPVACRSEVSITKTDGTDTYTPGANSTYAITVTNAGPHNLIGAVITDTLPVNVSSNGNWTCDPAVAPGNGSASCISGSAAGTTQNGTGDISLTVDIPANTSLVITLPVTYSDTP